MNNQKFIDDARLPGLVKAALTAKGHAIKTALLKVTVDKATHTQNSPTHPQAINTDPYASTGELARDLYLHHVRPCSENSSSVVNSRQVNKTSGIIRKGSAFPSHSPMMALCLSIPYGIIN